MRDRSLRSINNKKHLFFFLITFISLFTLGMFFSHFISGNPKNQGVSEVYDDIFKTLDINIDVNQDPAVPVYLDDVNITAHIISDVQLQTVLLETNLTLDFLGNSSFTNDSIGSNPAGWTITEEANTHFDVYESKSEHNQIVEVYDSYYGGTAFMYQNIAPTRQNGTLEFWVYCVEGNFYLNLYHSSRTKTT